MRHLTVMQAAVTLEVLAVAVPCVLLLVWVMRRAQRPEVPVAPREMPVSAPSTRAWQRWLEEAEDCAADGRWRDAVHSVYWAAISRLESAGLWPADRARTPREYLSLLRDGDVTRSGLRNELGELTRVFERIWYGRRPANEREYTAARGLLERLAPR